MKKVNHSFSFKFGPSQLLHIIKFLHAVTGLDFVLRAHKTNETKKFRLWEVWMYKKTNNKSFPQYGSFFSNLRKSSLFCKKL